ncbi:MAG: hypothetical protein IT385_17995 [Deltaproteobacteria bacterium]|nr:hypothetical protein [Deltaproteobacteria bacterium]
MSAPALVALAALVGAPEPQPAIDGADPWGCPVRAVDTDEPALLDLGPTTWRLEGHLVFQPDQPREHRCNRGSDCLSASRSFVAGAVRATREVPGAWSAALTLSLGRHLDVERIPVDGFGVFIVRGDFQLELGRGRETFGAALRVSPVLVVGWSATGTALRSDFPGFALLLGRRDLWGEVIVPAFPTHLDPRRFYLGAGWRDARFELEGGFATFGSLGYQRDEIDRATNNLGVWVAGSWRVPDGDGRPSRWELFARAAIAWPFVTGLGVGYRFDETGAP